MKEKNKIVSLSYNAMFKAIFRNNKKILSQLVQSIFDYLKLSINVIDKNLEIVNNELWISNAKDKQLVCDYRIKISDDIELNIEINRTYYSGLEERNLCYCFKIYCDHFKAGDDYSEFKKYLLVQVNFNNFANLDNEPVKEFFLLDPRNPKNYLTKNICIINVDIDSCLKKFYNDGVSELSSLERFGAMLKTDYLEDITDIAKGLIGMEEKKEFLEQIKDASKDKEVLKAIKLEDNIEYRFKLVEEDALKRGIEKGVEQGMEQGIEQNKVDVIIQLLKNNASLALISNVTGKSIDEIKKISKEL